MSTKDPVALLEKLNVEQRCDTTAAGQRWLTRSRNSMKPELEFLDLEQAADHWERKAVQLVYHYLLGRDLLKAAEAVGEGCQKDLDAWIDGLSPHIPDVLLNKPRAHEPMPSDWSEIAGQLIQRLGPLDSITIRMLLVSARNWNHAERLR